LIEVSNGAKLTAPYSTTNPSITSGPLVVAGPLIAFSAETTITGDDEIRYILQVDGLLRWWNGSKWVISDGTFERSNTEEEISANLNTSPIRRNNSLSVIASLHSATGSTTPILTRITLEWTEEVIPELEPISLIPLPNLIVASAGAKQIENGVVTLIEAVLKSTAALTATIAFLSENDLDREILSKSGLDENTAFATVETTSVIEEAGFFYTTIELVPGA
jgi:hypothetical protein